MKTGYRLYISTGILRYCGGSRLVLEVEPDLAAYYRALVTPHEPINRPKYPAHITVVRELEEKPTGPWGEHEGRFQSFYYSPEIQYALGYYWLNIYHTGDLQCIRESLGLPETSRWTRPPSGEDCFHVTIGNTKNL